MRLSIFCYFILFLVFGIFSQSYTELSGGVTPQIRYTITSEISKMEGSHYFNKDWKSGRIIYNDSSCFYLTKINLDLATNTFIFLENNSIYTLPITERVNKILIDEEKFIRIEFKEGINSFCRLIAGNSNLLLIECLQSKIIKGEPSKGFIKGTNDKYVVYRKYYFQNSAGKLSKKINLRKIHKTISSFIPDKKDLIQKFEIEEKIKISDLSSLIKFINFIDSVESN